MEVNEEANLQLRNYEQHQCIPKCCEHYSTFLSYLPTILRHLRLLRDSYRLIWGIRMQCALRCRCHGTPNPFCCPMRIVYLFLGEKIVTSLVQALLEFRSKRAAPPFTKHNPNAKHIRHEMQYESITCDYSIFTWHKNSTDSAPHGWRILALKIWNSIIHTNIRCI